MDEQRMRAAAAAEFERQWQQAAEAGTELRRVLDRLAAGMHAMAEHGAHLTVVFPDELVQAWWVAYQEEHGHLVPRSRLEPPFIRDLVEAEHSVRA